MEKSGKILRICLIFVAALVLIMGLAYFVHVSGTDRKVSEGTLITCIRNMGGSLWR